MPLVTLVNISGQATYIMVLKDSGGLVKLYALVNVENYGIVATGATQAEAMTAYRKLLVRNGIAIADVEDVLPHDDVTVENVRIVNLNDAATVYITGEDGTVYRGTLNEDESLVLIREGDKLSVTYENSDIEGIKIIRSWKRQ